MSFILTVKQIKEITESGFFDVYHKNLKVTGATSDITVVSGDKLEIRILPNQHVYGFYNVNGRIPSSSVYFVAGSGSNKVADGFSVGTSTAFNPAESAIITYKDPKEVDSSTSFDVWDSLIVRVQSQTSYYLYAVDNDQLTQNNINVLAVREPSYLGAGRWYLGQKVTYELTGSNEFFMTPDGVSSLKIDVIKNDGTETLIRTIHPTFINSKKLEFDPVPLMKNGEMFKAGSFKVEVRAGRTEVYTITSSDILGFRNNGVSMTVNDVELTVGTILYSGDVLKATALANRLFFVDSGGNPSVFIFTINNGFDHYDYFTLSDDFKTAEITLEPLESLERVQYISSITKQTTPEILGTNNVYIIDETQLAKINDERFIPIEDDKGKQTGLIDYGNFILSLMAVPFEIPKSIILLPEPIKLANLVLTATGNKLSQDIIEIDMGTISIPKVNNNALDYLNTTALLYLPRLAVTELSLEYVIGYDISIKYMLDCYTGKVTVNIISSRTGETISTQQADLGINIPYAGVVNSTAIISNSNIVVGGDNGIITPFIEIVRNEVILPTNEFNTPVLVDELISAQNGFVKIVDIDLQTGALQDEKSSIIDLLARGVFIK